MKGIVNFVLILHVFFSSVTQHEPEQPKWNPLGKTGAEFYRSHDPAVTQLKH